MNDRDIIIVQAQANDVQYAFELGVEFHAEMAQGAQFPPLAPARVAAVLAACEKAGGLFLAVNLQRELPVGVLAMTEMDYWYSESKFATDLLFYVAATGRGSGAARMLLERAKTWAQERDIPLMMAVTAAGNVEAKDKFFARRGLPRIGGIYLMGAE